MNNDLSTLICLFHHQDQANAALQDILKAGIPESNVTLIGGTGSTIEASRTSLTELNVPAKDLQHLLDGLKDGGAVLSVSAISSHAEKVDEIFKAHKAGKIDEATVADDMSANAIPTGLNSSDLNSTGLNSTGRNPSGLPRSEESGPLLITDDLVAAETSTGPQLYRVLTVTPLQEDTVSDVDVDPRELGLDSRLNPSSSKPANQTF